MNGDKSRLKNYLREFEKELYKQKKVLEQGKELIESIERGLNAFSRAEDLLGNPVLDKAFELEVKEKQLLQLFSEIEKTIARLSNSLVEKRQRLEEVKARLEKLREYRCYEFSSWQAMWEFIEELLEHYSIPRVSFKHEIIGIIDNSWLEKSFIKEKSHGIEVKGSDLNELSRLLESKGIKKGFYLETDFFKAFWKSSTQILVKADNKTIKEIDSACVLKGGKILPE